MELQERFLAATAGVQSIGHKPSNDVMLQLYALYKQATAGDVSGEEPDMFDFVAAAKYRAWKNAKGTTKEDAMTKYITIVENLKS